MLVEDCPEIGCLMEVSYDVLYNLQILRFYLVGQNNTEVRKRDTQNRLIHQSFRSRETSVVGYQCRTTSLLSSKRELSRINELSKTKMRKWNTVAHLFLSYAPFSFQLKSHSIANGHPSKADENILHSWLSMTEYSVKWNKSDLMQGFDGWRCQ